MKKLFLAVIALFLTFSSNHASDSNTTIKCLVINNLTQDLTLNTSEKNTVTLSKATTTPVSLDENYNFYPLTISLKNNSLKKSNVLNISYSQNNPVFLIAIYNKLLGVNELHRMNYNNDSVIFINNSSSQDFTLTIPVSLTTGTIKNNDEGWFSNTNKTIDLSSSDSYTVTTTYQIPAKQVTMIQRPDLALQQGTTQLIGTLKGNSHNQFYTNNSTSDVLIKKNNLTGTIKALLTINATETNNAAIFSIKNKMNNQYLLNNKFVISKDQQ